MSEVKGLSVAELRALANAAADEAEIDMSETQSGGGFSKLYPAGYAFARLVEYVEFGNHPDEYDGKVKPPALTFRLGFAIWGTPPNQPNGATESYHNADGTPGLIRTYSMRLGNNEKAGSKIAFDRLNYKGKAKQFYQFIGDAFLVHITQHQGKDTTKPKRNRIVLKDTLPPHDPATGTPYKIEEAPESMYQLFIWNRPTKQGWDSLFIEGKTDAGKSKNFLQELCYSAVDFEGSPLQQLLGGSSSLPSPEALAAEVPALEPENTPVPEAAPSAPVVVDTPAPAAPTAPIPPAPPVV